MNDYLVVERLDEKECDGQDEDAENAEKANAEIHSEKSDNGVNANIH